MGRRKKGDKIDGWVNLNKPLGMTSTQAVGKIRRLYNAQKAGHAGTLDPLATGILPIALGEATKTVPYIQDELKTYIFKVTWGQQRSTDDAEGDVIAESEHRPLADDITAALPAFTGDIEQTPPKFSAIKIDGQRAYDLARGGQDVQIKSRNVYVESLKLIEAAPDEATLECVCGKGTYIRSIARDLAENLGTKGYVSYLHRACVGPFNDKDAILLDKLEEMGDSAARLEELLPIGAALDDIPALPISSLEAATLRNGGRLSFVSRHDFGRLSEAGIDPKANEIALAVCDDLEIALITVNGPEIKPVKVFNL